MKYLIMALDAITPALYETKAAIQYSSGIFKGLIIFSAVILLAIWFYGAR